MVAFVAAFASLATAHAQPEPEGLNHFRFSARSVFNIKGGFADVGSLALNPGRITPDGSAYNYDDGYVLTDASGNAGGQTWNWGYDSASQLSGDSILMHRTTALAGTGGGSGLDSADPSLGFELVYARELGRSEKLRYGVEVALDYVGVSLDGARQSSGTVTLTTDTYGFTPGTTPPGAPYQGTFNGPGFLIGFAPVDSDSTTAGATVSGRYQLDADVWGGRVGPYVEFPLAERVGVTLSGGLAAAMINLSGEWSETVNIDGSTTSRSGSGSSEAWEWGAYIGAAAVWHVSPRWNVAAGVELLHLGTSSQTLGGRPAELDLSQAVNVTIGVGYDF
jgi:YD repeat-containing protein